jgi:hypothetical protein
MLQAVKDELNLRRKLSILEIVEATGKIAQTCCEFNVQRSSFYNWKKKFAQGGREALVTKKPIPLSPPSNCHWKSSIGKSDRFGQESTITSI